MKFVDLGILIGKTLVISDLHIGYEEALNKQGILVPRFQFPKLERALMKLLDKEKPSTVVINGDLKHEFGAISEQEWRETLKVIDMITKKAKLILIKGNHDTILSKIAGKRNVEIKEYHMENGFYICHGDKIPENFDFVKARNVIIGHEHPAITLREGVKQETYKCFLKFRFKGKNIYVLPSFNFTAEGTDITKEKLLSPFLAGAKEAEVTVSQNGKLYSFGKVKLLSYL